jgi:hypothetical protein
VNAKAAERLYDEAVDGYFARHRMKPGITGWAQINGWRGETDTAEKIQAAWSTISSTSRTGRCCSISTSLPAPRLRWWAPRTPIDQIAGSRFS